MIMSVTIINISQNSADFFSNEKTFIFCFFERKTTRHHQNQPPIIASSSPINRPIYSGNSAFSSSLLVINPLSEAIEMTDQAIKTINVINQPKKLANEICGFTISTKNGGLACFAFVKNADSEISMFFLIKTPLFSGALSVYFKSYHLQ